MWPTICPMLHPASPPTAGGRHAAAAGGSAATSRSVRCRTLSKKRRYDAISVITSSSSSLPLLDLSVEGPTVHPEPLRCGCQIAPRRFKHADDVAMLQLRQREI